MKMVLNFSRSHTTVAHSPEGIPFGNPVKEDELLNLAIPRNFIFSNGEKKLKGVF